MSDLKKDPDNAPGAEFENFLRYDNFGLDYAESLTEGDLRPYVIKDYKNENEEEG